MSVNTDYHSSIDFPEELSKSQNGFSVDVLIYDIETTDHAIGWYDFEVMTWRFVSNEPHKKFVWRYLNNKIDKPNI